MGTSNRVILELKKRFVDNGDGTVTDTLTQLMWMQKDSYLDLLRFVTHKGSLKYAIERRKFELERKQFELERQKILRKIEERDTG
mgnify:CR=1 FL=1